MTAQKSENYSDKVQITGFQRLGMGKGVIVKGLQR